MSPHSDNEALGRRRWLTALFPALDAAMGGADDEARRRVVLGVAALLAGPMTLYHCWLSFRLGLPGIAFLSLVTSALIFGVYVAVRSGAGRWTSRVALTSVVLLQLFAAATAAEQFSLVWAMLVPLLTIFFFGRLEGAVWSLLVLVLFTALLLNPHLAGVDPETDFWPLRGAIEDFVFAYVLATLLAVAYESLRFAVQRRLHDLVDARAAAEARMRDFNRIGTDLLFELDDALRVTHLSGNWAELTGIPTEAIIGLPFQEEDARYTRRGWQAVQAKLEARQPVRDERIEFTFADGREMTIEVRMEPLWDAQGRFTGYRGVGVDVSERIRTEQELRNKDRALQQAARMEAVGQLTSGVAHDFNNLLTVILGNLEMLQQEAWQQGERTEQLDQVAGAARSAADLTRKLLAFSRRQALRPARIDTAVFLEETTNLLARILPETITVHCRPDAAVQDCRADRSQLESALLNLALNARDAMPDGGVLELRAADCDLDADRAAALELAPGPYVCFRIVDTGRGMPRETAERIFEPFFTTKPVGHGTGLGLSMVYGFVRQSGGAVQVDSTPDRGTTVALLIPQAEAGDSVAEHPRPSARRGTGQTVLVIEDEPAVRDLVVTMLVRLGYHALAACDGEAGLRLFSEVRPSVVISDVVLAGALTGVDTIAAIRELAPETPVLFMSGYSEAAVGAGKGLPEEVPLLAKPFAMAELQSRLERLLETGG